MPAALVIMAIMGCDDSATHCHYIETAPGRYESVAECDGASEATLSRITNRDYPVVVAACQAEQVTHSAPAPAAARTPAQPEMILVEAGRVVDPPRPSVPVEPKAPAAAEDPSGQPRLTARALDAIRSALPARDTIAGLAEKPVHVVTDTYAWIARRIVP